MRRLAINAAIALALGAGLTLALLWTLGAPFPRTIHAQGNRTRYVALSGEDSGDCSDSADPCRTVQYAVDQAASGDEIRVAAGTYTGVRSRAGVAQVVYISKTVTIRGGYTTTDWSTPDPDANPTTLDAQEKGRVLYIAGDISPTIEGLRIINGDAEGLGGGPWSAADAGGGVYVDAATVIISGSQVVSGAARYGGGLYLNDSAVRLMDSLVADNRADTSGGGIYLQYSSGALQGNTIAENGAGWGSGVYLYASSEVRLSDNTVADNEADNVGGGMYVRESDAALTSNIISGNRARFAGGVYLRDSGADLTANTILSNTVSESGGGIYVHESGAKLSQNAVFSNTANYGGGVYVLFSAAALLEENLITSNEANRSGGGVYLHKSDAGLSGNRIYSNTARYEGGGGIYLLECRSVLTNTLIADNRARTLGSGVTVWDGMPRLLHTTLARNSGGSGGIYVGRGSIALTNTILVSHSLGICLARDAAARLESTLWGADAWANQDDWDGPGEIITGTRNYWGDPAFVDAEAADYHIEWTSAARDKGIDAGVTIDIDGQPRPMPIEGGPDLGADECTAVDLSPSRKMASPRQVDAGGVLTYTVVLLNSGPLSAANTLLFDAIPPRTTYISGSAASGVLTYVGGIRWMGTVMPHEPVTVTYWVTVNEKAFVENTALVTDQYGTMTTLRAWVNGWRSYLPFILRESKGL